MADAQICSACGAGNDAQQRFCGTCGAPLARACPACGAENPSSFRFCGTCGASLERAPATPALPQEGELRRATVLFADLSGFTSVSERLEPEEVSALVDRCMGVMGGIVSRFGGRVARVIGDELMGLFGAPLAHEDDPERAVRAALELQQAARENVEEFGRMTLRVGVNTGEMMFGPIGPEREFTVMGDAVNTAKRLQTAAPVGGVLVGEETYRVTRRGIRYEPVAPFEAKGKAEPVRAWRAVAAEAKASQRPVSSAPIVGRSTELDLLRRIWSRAESERRPSLVTVIGPPGIGKTRITGELTAPLEALGVRVLRGRSLPYGESTGYGSFAQQLHQLAGIREDDPAPDALRKLRSAIASVAPEEEADVGRALPALAGFDTGEAAPERPVLFLAARRFVEALGRGRPSVLVFEDVHWADATLIDLVETLASRCRDAPLLFVALARPELLDRRPGWGGGLASHTALHLESLSPGDSERLVRALLARDGDAGIVERLVETAGGNPLFLEELAATVSERAEDPVSELPTSVTGIIAARLDTLPHQERRVLLDASVVGKMFWRGALTGFAGEGSLDASLDALEARDLIRREPSSSIAGDVQYLFKHMLIREVAYQTLPKAVRRERHRSVAAFIEDAAGDRVAESASLLAHHWREAGDKERAVEFLLMAAEHAGKAWAKHEAIALCTEALELIPEAKAARRRSVRLRRGIERVSSGDFEGAVADIDPILDDLSGRERIEGSIALARAAFWQFHADEGIRLAERAVADAGAIGASDLVAPAMAAHSVNLSIIATRVRDAIEMGERALDLWVPGVYEDMLAVNVNQVGLFSYWVGDYEKAVDFCRRGFELSQQIQGVEGILAGGANLGLALTGVGGHAEAVTVFEKVIAHGRELGTAGRFVARALNMLAGTLRELLDIEEARVYNEEAIDMAAAAGFAVAEGQGGIDLALADLLSGDVGRAEKRIPALQELAEKAKGFHQWLVAGRLGSLGAEVALARGAPEEAAEAAGRSLAEALRVGRVKYEVASRLTLGRALHDLGRPEEAAAEFDLGLTAARRLGHPPSIWSSASRLAGALAATGRDDAAGAASGEAGRTIAAFAQTLSEPRRSRFLEASSVREILALGR